MRCSSENAWTAVAWCPAMWSIAHVLPDHRPVLRLRQAVVVGVPRPRFRLLDQRLLQQLRYPVVDELAAVVRMKSSTVSLKSHHIGCLQECLELLQGSTRGFVTNLNVNPQHQALSVNSLSPPGVGFRMQLPERSIRLCEDATGAPTQGPK